MEDDDDDIYGNGAPVPHNNAQSEPPTKTEESDEVDEENEEDSDSDIDIITERKPTSTRSEQTTQTSQVKNEHITSTSVDQKPSRSAAIPIKPDPSSKPSASQKPGYEYPEVHTSSVKIDDEPTYEPVGKPITEVDFDADLAEHDKPWRRPGADQTDYFNYGFDEFTWAMYCLKQKSMRDTITEQKAESAKFEAMLGGGMPGMGSGPPTGPSGAQPNPQQNQQASMPTGMPGMPDPDMMNQMMQQMMSQGIDPSQMDFNTFMSHMQGQGGGGGAQSFGGQAQGQAYGDVNAGGGVGGAGGGGGRGRGRRGGRW